MDVHLGNFLISLTALVIGFALFFLRRKNRYEKSVDSLVTIILIMATVGLTYPLLAEYKGYRYFFPPIFLLATNVWLFFAKNKIITEIIWLQRKDQACNVVLICWSVLMIGFFVITIYLVVSIPNELHFIQ